MFTFPSNDFRNCQAHNAKPVQLQKRNENFELE